MRNRRNEERNNHSCNGIKQYFMRKDKSQGESRTWKNCISGLVYGVKAIPLVRSAFTLVELLIVISIIVLLISILLPALKNAKGKAQEILCLGNQKQIGNVINMYCDDSNGFLPAAYNYNSKTWGQLIYDMGYISSKQPDIFVCPTYPPRKYETAGKTYGFRCYWGSDTLDWYLRLSDLGKPFNQPQNKYFIFADAMHYIGKYQWYQFYMGDASSDRKIHLRHSRRANTLFPDGSAKSEPIDFFSTQGNGVWALSY